MKKIILIFMCLVLLSCKDEKVNIDEIENKIDENIINQVVEKPPIVITYELEIDPVLSENSFKDNRRNNKSNINDYMLKLLKPETYNYDQSIIQIIEDPISLYVMGNKINQLPLDFIPGSLVKPDVPFSFSGEDEKKYMVEDAALALEKLFDAALEEEIELVAVSGYRSFERQEAVYNYWVSIYGVEETDKFSARPGHSEHQTGLTMDVSCESLDYNLEYSFGNLPEGEWLKNNAYKYGFIIRYPEYKTEVTGYNYEPWHIRYLGLDIAGKVYESGLTLEEYFMTLLD